MQGTNETVERRRGCDGLASQRRTLSPRSGVWGRCRTGSRGFCWRGGRSKKKSTETYCFRRMQTWLGMMERSGRFHAKRSPHGRDEGEEDSTTLLAGCRLICQMGRRKSCSGVGLSGSAQAQEQPISLASTPACDTTVGHREGGLRGHNPQSASAPACPTPRGRRGASETMSVRCSLRRRCCGGCDQGLA